LTAPDLGSEVNCLIKPISPSHILSILSEYNDPEERKHGKINLATTPKDSEETIPKSEINTSEIDTKEVSNIQDKQPQTVFVVDDNEINRIVGKGILGALPVTIETAINGEDLLEKLQKLSPLTQLPVILMDCQMPILDGYAATRLIREGKAGDWLQNTPIIAMTADAMNENKIECKTAGMDDFIAKPFDPEKLKQLVSQWSNKKP
jgi:CheY-like chemotaxis protein